MLLITWRLDNLTNKLNVIFSFARAFIQPDCPVCHAIMSIDLEGPSLDPVHQAGTSARQGILGRLDMSKCVSFLSIPLPLPLPAYVLQVS